MTNQTLTLQDTLDRAPLDRRYWSFFAVASLSTTIDFFDFFIAGFLVSVVAPQWQLTYGESAIILLAAGLGAVVGPVVGGYLCDRYGRRPVVILGSIACGVSAGAVAFIPDGAWLTFASLRFFTGLSISAVYSAIIVLIVERTPGKHRTVVTSLAFVSTSAGILMATLTSATLIDVLGWRGLALLSALPIVPGLLAIVFVPESVLWQLANGKEQQARAAAARQLGHSVADIPINPVVTRDAGGIGLRELYAYPRAFWLVVLMWFGFATAIYGVYAWGPTVIVLTQGITAQQAAQLFLTVSIAGITGKIIFSIVPRWIGRRRTGQISMAIAAAGLAFAALSPSMMSSAVVFGLPIFVVFLAVFALTGEGGAAGMPPYSAEVFPVRLAARGAGLGQTASGIGKIVGPISLGLIAGADNLVAPKATLDAVLPGFMFLAGCLAVASLAFTFLGIETHGRKLTLDSEEPQAKRPGTVVPTDAIQQIR